MRTDTQLLTDIKLFFGHGSWRVCGWRVPIEIYVNIISTSAAGTSYPVSGIHIRCTALNPDPDPDPDVKFNYLLLRNVPARAHAIIIMYMRYALCTVLALYSARCMHDNN